MKNAGVKAAFAWCVFSCLALCLLGTQVRAEAKIPALSEIPAVMAPDSRAQLTKRRQALRKELADFQAAAKVFNAKDAKDQSDAEYEALDAWRTRYINKAKAFNKAVSEADTGKFPPAAANLVNIMDNVTKKLKRPKGGYHKDLDPKAVCNFFFQGVGEDLRRLGLPTGAGAWKKGLKAQQIKEAIETNETKEWKKVEEKDVQNLANQGIIVVAVSHDHVAIAFPVPPDIKPSTQGPRLRDGNEHPPHLQADHRLYASSWGAIPSHKMFSYKDESNTPSFYVWTPSASPYHSLGKYKNEIAPRVK